MKVLQYVILVMNDKMLLMIILVQIVLTDQMKLLVIVVQMALKG